MHGWKLLNSQKEADGEPFHSFCPLALLPRDQFGMCSVGFGFPRSDVACACGDGGLEDGYAFWLWVVVGKGALARSWTLCQGSALHDELEAPAGL